MMNSASQSGNKSFKRNRLPGKNGFKKKNTSYLWQEEKKLNFETLHNPTQQKNDETSSKTQLIFSNMNTHTNPSLTATSRPNARNTYKLIYNLKKNRTSSRQHPCSSPAIITCQSKQDLWTAMRKHSTYSK